MPKSTKRTARAKTSEGNATSEKKGSQRKLAAAKATAGRKKSVPQTPGSKQASSEKTTLEKSPPADQADPALKARAARIAAELAVHYGDAVCALDHQNPFQLLAATILSAQCTDERVNMVTPELFRRWPTPAALAEAKQEDVEQVIQSTGFYRNKAANLIGMAQGLVSRYGGTMPKTLEELIVLPGVGRKTANVLLGTAFGIPSGVVVDTHVKRITNLLGLTSSDNPETIEQELMELLPQSEWINFSHRLIHHGRRVCVARRPQCDNCHLRKLCNRVGLK